MIILLAYLLRNISSLKFTVYMVAGAYEPPKEHETCTTCRVPSQSKFITKYFPYKESKILLFEAVYRMRVTTKQQWRRFIVYN